MHDPAVPDGDEQDLAELLDDDVVQGDDADPTDAAGVTDPPAEWRGLPFADADVTDESFAERSAQEEPELSPRDIDERLADAVPPVEASGDE